MSMVDLLTQKLVRFFVTGVVAASVGFFAGTANAQDRHAEIANLILQAEAEPAIASGAYSSSEYSTSGYNNGDSLLVLSSSDEALYREIFDLQEKRQMSRADKKIDQLSNEILLGYVQSQRYLHPTAWRSSFSELKKWMAFYADHPNADEIYKLAIRRRPKGASNPRAPERRKWRQKEASTLHPLLEEDYARKRKSRVRQIEGRVRYLINKSRALEGLKYIDSHAQRRDITERQYDRMRSWIAASLYYQGYLSRAKTIAGSVADRNGDTAVLSYWIDGLIAYRETDMNRAYRRFQAMADVGYQDDDLRSAAAYWATRAALATGDTTRLYENLDLAARYPFTFYGQLALSQLGRSYDFNWSDPVVTDGGFEALATKIPGIRRAAALAQIGKTQEADLEMRWANGLIEHHEDYDLIAIAAALNLPAAQIDIALLGKGENLGKDYLHAALFPIPDFTPNPGFETDRALLYALMRQESKFKPQATSRVGARGLMQLMPRTASFIGRDRSLQRVSGRNRLYDPGFNLELGQKYVNHLFDNAARGNVLHMAVAYNGGPGNLSRWKKQMEIEDPLLFIESIPNTESRNFAESVLTNLWIYRARLGQEAPSRDRIASGQSPIFREIDHLTQDF